VSIRGEDGNEEVIHELAAPMDAPPPTTEIRAMRRAGGAIPTGVTVRQGAVTVSCKNVDDTFIVNADTQQILKVTGPPFGPGQGQASVALGGGSQGFGTETTLTFELWNSTGGRAHVEIFVPGDNGNYDVIVDGWTLPTPGWPVWKGGLHVVQPQQH
jgi:hypothetical protein